MVIVTEAPKGYKKTDIGIIPEEWDVKPLNDLFSFSGGFTASRDQLSDEGFCYLHYGDIHKTDKTYIDVKGEYPEIPKLDISLSKISPKSLLNEGDIVFVDASEDDEGASKHIVVRNADGITYISGLHTIVAKSKDSSLVDLYKEYCFQTRNIKRQFKYYAVGTKVSGISKTNIAKILLPLPPEPEQRTIATILSDIDEAIIKLESLISKKRNVKQGAMQELLTGKKRLPGFNGKWETKTLLELINCLDTLRVPLNDNQRLSMKGDYPYCGANGVLDYINQYMIDDDIVLIAEDGGYFDEYATRPIAYRMTGKCWVNNHAHILKAKENISQDFIFYSLVHKNILSFLASGTRAKLNKSEMYKIEINLPLEKNEQSAIAKVLTDMDVEIEELEVKLGKYKRIKQGMMQVLLTGKKRLL